MLCRSMVSRIPFQTGKPIIDIPVMRVVTTRLEFEDDGLKGLYTFLINNYTAMRGSFGRLSIEADSLHTPVSVQKFSPCWCYIRLVSLSPLLTYASFAKEFSFPELFETKKNRQQPPTLFGGEDVAPCVSRRNAE